MDRRSVLKSVALLVGGSVVGGELFLSGCKQKGSSSSVEGLFEAEQTAYLDEIAETILPKTNTPGAKEAKVGAFMAVMVRDCYTPEDQKVFIDGLKKIDELSETQFKKSFMDATPEQRTQLLIQLDKEQKDYKKNKKDSEPNHYFALIKQLTLLGYFTSEPGATKAMRYVPVPGKYEGDYPYKKGDKAWALS